MTQNEKRAELRTWLKNYFGGKCFRCGYDKCLGALHFHHRKPEKKIFGLTEGMIGKNGVSKKTKEELIREALKCDLLCANCHAEEHEKKWLTNKMIKKDL